VTHVQFAVDDTRASLRAGGDIQPRRHRCPGSLLPRRRPIDAELSQTLPLACESRVLPAVGRGGAPVSPSHNDGQPFDRGRQIITRGQKRRASQ